MPALVLVSGLAIALATVAGASLARRQASRRDLCLGAAAGALLVIAGLLLLPDAWSAALGAGLPVVVVPAAALTAFTMAGLAVRRGCACQDDREKAGGTATAGALAVHRLLEGAALAVAGSAAVAVALTVHAFAEGLAAGTLLTSASRRRAALWLTVMCVSPAAGAVITRAIPVPAAAQPVLLGAAAGVLGQAAWVSLRAVFGRAPASRASLSGPATAMLATAVVTALAVWVVG
jgi:zinc transporter ZupT